VRGGFETARATSLSMCGERLTVKNSRCASAGGDSAPRKRLAAGFILAVFTISAGGMVQQRGDRRPEANSDV